MRTCGRGGGVEGILFILMHLPKDARLVSVGFGLHVWSVERVVRDMVAVGSNTAKARRVNVLYVAKVVGLLNE